VADPKWGTVASESRKDQYEAINRAVVSAGLLDFGCGCYLVLAAVGGNLVSGSEAAAEAA